jgi:hypothetical protein
MLAISLTRLLDGHLPAPYDPLFDFYGTEDDTADGKAEDQFPHRQGLDPDQTL